MRFNELKNNKSKKSQKKGGENMTHDEYVVELAIKNPNVEIIDEYVNQIVPVMHRCKIHDYKWMVRPGNALNAKGCPKCSKTYRKTHEEYVAELKETNPHIIVLGKYIDAKTKVLYKCTIHNVEWETLPHIALNGCGCSMCKSDLIRLRLTKEEEKYNEELAQINPNIEAIEEYVNSHTKIKHRCKICGYNWMVTPTSTLSGHGCPKCGIEKSVAPRRKTHEQYVEELKITNPNVEVLGVYSGADTKILHKCKLDGYEWFATPENVKKYKSCPMCYNKPRNPHENYVNRISEINPNVIPIETYKTCKDKILHKCRVCGNEWKTTPEVILMGCGCPLCSIKKQTKEKTKTNDQYLLELSQINPNIEPLEEYKNSNTPIKHRCKIDNYEWFVTPAHLLHDTGCPLCNNSKGELAVRKWLDNHNISYITQKKFDDCKDKRRLPFDFYLPEFNTCIEYDGEQHYRMVTFGCSDIELCNRHFERTKRHDEMKNKYCEDNGIRLIRISYYENVKEKLDLLLA